MNRISFFVLFLLFLTSTQGALASGYAVCQDAASPQPFIQCNTTSCPSGSTLISYNPGDHENCNGGGNTGEFDWKAYAEQCHSNMHLKQIGYSGGHKTHYCQDRGYDGNVGWNCVRDCSKKCTKAFLRTLGWKDGDKTGFCRNLGYDGTHGAPGGDYNEVGYCYKGDPEICTKL